MFVKVGSIRLVGKKGNDFILIDKFDVPEKGRQMEKD